jgi:hypothetical protein
MGFIFGLIAVALARGSIHRTNTPGAPGRGMAATGLVTGVVATLFGLFLVVAFVVGVTEFEVVQQSALGRLRPAPWSSVCLAWRLGPVRMRLVRRATENRGYLLEDGHRGGSRTSEDADCGKA